MVCTSMNVPKTNELYLNGWILRHVNYISIKLSKRKPWGVSTSTHTEQNLVRLSSEDFYHHFQVINWGMAESTACYHCVQIWGCACICLFRVSPHGCITKTLATHMSLNGEFHVCRPEWEEVLIFQSTLCIFVYESAYSKEW